ncbi:MAG: hypothetical protein WC146_01565 [Patescibacteria group bacterium]|jgi:hypothetical protein
MAQERMEGQPKIEKSLEAVSEGRQEIIASAPERIPVPAENQQENDDIKEIKKNIGGGALNALPSYQKQRELEIDNILAEGLGAIFLKMDQDNQKKFKKKGEETAATINILLNKTKINVGKIINLIKNWLKLIPGINKFFLEQEAKIKADAIIRIKDKF